MQDPFANPPKQYMDLIYDPECWCWIFHHCESYCERSVLLFLYKEFAVFKWIFDRQLWKKVMNYSYPLIIVGFGGMINEMFSRVIYRKVLQLDEFTEKRELGIFGANYKLAVLITIFIQIFRLAAEPFFFNQSPRKTRREPMPRVMKFFVIACCFMFLLIALFPGCLEVIDRV